MSIWLCIMPIHIKNADTALPDLFGYQSVMEKSDTQSQDGFILESIRLCMVLPNSFTFRYFTVFRQI